MDLEALEKMIKGRRSIRQWKKERVPDELIKKAIELATWAPNGGNFQGWHFIVVKNQSVIEKMANSVQSAIDKVASFPEAVSWKEELQRFQKNASYFRNAPVCIGAFMGRYQTALDKVLTARESFDQEAKEILSFRRVAQTPVQSVAAAVTTMLLVFHNMGLGAVWLVGPQLARKKIEEILKPPEGMDFVCLVAVGYPDESPQKDRKPVEQVLEFIN